MKKYRLLSAAALIVLPSMLVSNAGYSVSRLPPINADAGQYRQQSCPVERQNGCFNAGIRSVAGGTGNTVFTSADQFRFTPFGACLQFMQRIASGAG